MLPPAGRVGRLVPTGNPVGDFTAYHIGPERNGLLVAAIKLRDKLLGHIVARQGGDANIVGYEVYSSGNLHRRYLMGPLRATHIVLQEWVGFESKGGRKAWAKSDEKACS